MSTISIQAGQGNQRIGPENLEKTTMLAFQGLKMGLFIVAKGLPLVVVIQTIGMAEINA